MLVVFPPVLEISWDSSQRISTTKKVKEAKAKGNFPKNNKPYVKETQCM